MNTIWSTLIQRPETLYFSRALRFSDMFREKYRNAFDADGAKRFLEIGCGPGALSQALHRWYPDAEVIGSDRDTQFLEFAKSVAPDIAFVEEDATSLSFAENSFDVTISNTVAEHVEPSKFFGEQYRVLKPNGICLVLSARRGINISAPCVCEVSDFEKEIWNRVEPFLNDIDKKNAVCQYPMNEAEYPLYMQKCGFRDVSTEYLTINLTPDNPTYDRETAHAMINANREGALNRIRVLEDVGTELVRPDEIAEIKRLVNAKYDKRLELYDAGVKQWDTNVSVTMVIRGVK